MLRDLSSAAHGMLIAGGQHESMIDYLNGLLLVLAALAVATAVIGAAGIALLTTARCAAAGTRPRPLR